MTREESNELIYMLTIIKEQAIKSNNDTAIINVKIDSFNFVIDEAIKVIGQEPCDGVCEWFEQYVDIATDIVELRFSDGTAKKAKRGLYMRDIEKSIRKMLIDQIANEKKQEPKWIPVSERLPEKSEYGKVLVTYIPSGGTLWTTVIIAYYSDLMGIAEPSFHIGEVGKGSFRNITEQVIAWMPFPEPYKAESEG